MSRIYNACHIAVSAKHGSPPNSFLDELIDTIETLQDDVFAPNNYNDIYSVMFDKLALGVDCSIAER